MSSERQPFQQVFEQILRSGGTCVCWLSEGSVKMMGLLDICVPPASKSCLFWGVSSWVKWLNFVDFQVCS